jgi:hypothetical protein
LSQRFVDGLHHRHDVAALDAVGTGSLSAPNTMKKVAADLLERLGDRKRGAPDVTVAYL